MLFYKKCRVTQVENYPYHFACFGCHGKMYRKGYKVTLEGGLVVYLCERDYYKKLRQSVEKLQQ